MTRFMMFLLAALLMAEPCHAALKVVGKGESMTFDPSGFPPRMKSSWEIMKTKCVRCHSMERTVVSITSGVASISGQPFDHDAVRAYGFKMMRKPESNMSRQEIKSVVDLMNYMLDEAAR